MYFEAKIRKEGNGYRVTFPGLENVLTYAETREKAVSSASEALVGCLLEDLDRGLDLPTPVMMGPKKGTVLIPIPASIGVALLLRKFRREQGRTTLQVAKRLGITRQAYEKLERGRGNPSLQTLDKTFAAFGVTFDLITRRKEAA
ncbi:MAG: type II toxin-antitoxin system HicB family antitoxin [Pseudomonadota bacterium]